MRWTHIRASTDPNFEYEMKVIQEKTGTELTVPVHDKLAAELVRHSRSLGTILHHGGKPYSRSTIRKRLQTWAAGHGLEIVPHGLRKNAVNALLEAGCSVGGVSSISGQSLQIVEHYAKKRDQAKLASAAIIKWQGNRK